MSVDAAFAQLRDANPVPRPAALRDTPHDAPGFLLATRQRSREMKTKLEEPKPVEASKTSRRRWVPALTAFVVAIVAVASVAIFSGDSGSDVAAAELGPVTSFEDIAGTTYERQGTGAPFFFHIFEDGTYHGSSNRDLVEELPQAVFETRFEGTKIFVTQTKGLCDDNPDSIYEIHLLENGNVEFVAIEDTCATRLTGWTVEWAPVP